MNGQNMNVVWEPVPYNAGIPATGVFDILRVHPDRPGFSGDGGFELVVAEGLEGFE